MARRTDGDVHYHGWRHPDDGSDGGKDSVLLRVAHPFRTRQAARAWASRMFGDMFEAVMPCSKDHAAHRCNENCPSRARRVKGEKARD